jgi:hypothetical protein
MKQAKQKTMAAILSKTLKQERENTTDAENISNWGTEEKDSDEISCVANSMPIETCNKDDVNTLDKRFFCKTQAKKNKNWITLKALIDTGAEVNSMNAKQIENWEQKQRDIFQVDRSKVGDTNVLRHKKEIGFLPDENSILQHKFYTTTHMTHDVAIEIPYLGMRHPTFDWTSGKFYFKKTNTMSMDFRKDKI